MSDNTEITRIDLAVGWYLVRDDDANKTQAKASRGERFLSDPKGVWVAAFWDGPEAGEQDAKAFAAALGATII